MDKKRFLINITFALACAGIFACLGLSRNSLYESFEAKTYDIRFKLRGDIPQRQDILLLEMDQQAIQDLGRWPWPRDIFAKIIHTLSSLGARAIVFDVTFTEPTQLVIDRKKLSLGLRLEENKRILQNFIDDMQEAVEAGRIELPEVKGAFGQIKEGIEVWEKDISQTLAEAIRDNDLILAKAIKEAGNVYLGYKFEVVYTATDILRNQSLPRLEAELRAWSGKNPRGRFAELPTHLRGNPNFSPEEVDILLKRARIYNLLNKDLETELAEVASSIGETDLASLRPHYNDVKAGLYGERLKQLLQEDPELSFKELVWRLGLFEPSNVQLLRERYENLLLEKTFSEKVGISYPGKATFLTAVNMSPPIMSLVEAMKAAGFLNALPDEDGTLRRVPLFVRYQGRLYPHIALKVIFDLWDIQPPRELIIKPGRYLKVKGRRIPIDRDGFLLVNWAGRWENSFKHLSCSEVYRLWQLKTNLEENLKLSPRELKEAGLEQTLEQDRRKLQEASKRLSSLVKDKICIIGLTAAGTHDYTPIPLQPDYPAVGTHANILNTILEEDYLRRATTPTNLTAIFALAILTGVCAALLSPLFSLISVFLIVGLYSLSCIFLFKQQGLWIDMVGPLGTTVLSYIGIVSYNFATEEKEKRWIRKAFGHYVSKNVMEEILKDPSKLRLGGERRKLSVLFSDIRNFTTYSEKRKPEEVVAILNEYLDEMTKVIFRNNGTLDKYVGDEIMAIFGAPSKEIKTDHARQAVLTALDMLEALKRLQEKWKSEGKEPIDIGIGINTGDMLVGNMGSTERMDYTVIGDAVNLGARIEALTRQYNNHIMISEFTYEEVKDMVEVKRLDAIRVKGKAEPVLMYEVLGLKEECRDVKG
jgi:adenylate cyclase